MQFRQKALSKLQSPEELDLPVRFARPQGRLVLAVTVFVTAAAAFWAFTGTVTSKVPATGVLSRAEGRYLLQSPVAGQVTEVLAAEGRTVAAGDPLIVVRTADGDRQVRAVAAGRLAVLYARTGAVVTAGADVAAVERGTDPDEPLVAVVYVPAGAVAGIRPGATVDVTVRTAGQGRDGALRGRVTAVGRAPQSRAQIGGFLGDDGLAAEFTRQGNPVAVLVRLPAPPAGPEAADSGTPVTAAVHLSAQRPIDWLLP
ncbi:HlyD family efflux transporter periplasmic adaptor subunit [Streptomyces sp. SKN60]|uniref:HlyD family efflux transporter periplasmic adaptor subunit n=1 Tax=Streptomyces sp. SKN60 TaxID=2855506 RepID=UPI002246702C|nr:HlyD family efflux transporter periplasmic adaptor subunit [Streptomyces sp. SKN60]MCX2180627.1 HlyD family efflux transporter periplasmic adaptor subunit [Streptomyces sp. SKN60]